MRAARELFTRDGYAATTVTAVAAAAHVSLDTVYASVGRKPELVLAVIDGVLGSSDEPVGLEEREYVKAIRRTPSARGKIEVYAAAVGRLVPQIAPLEDALRRAAEGDAECAAVWARMLERRSANIMLLAEELRGTGELRTDLSDREVADIVGSTSAVDYHLLPGPARMEPAGLRAAAGGPVDPAAAERLPRPSRLDRPARLGGRED